MFNIFQLKNNHLFRINNDDITSVVNKAIWIDIIQPNAESEHNYIQYILNQHKIKFFELKNNKKNNYFFKDKYKLFIHSLFLSHKNHLNQVNNSTVSFMIFNDRLYTLRNEKFPIFCTYQKSLHNHLIINNNAYELLLNLFEIKLEDLTDKIEHIYSSLDTLSLTIMNKQQKINDYDHFISDLKTLENIGWKIHINLLNTERTIKFLIKKAKLLPDQKKYAYLMLKDITTLLPHNKYIFQKINFLTQSAMGFINIEQNRIIKIFSVIFLPPTLIASIYGMNFEFMPELHWSFGYPVVIILMILTGLVPYLFFKYKNWL